MAHLTEEELAQYAFDPESVPNAREIEAHVASCPQCSSSLTFMQTVESGLSDPEVWQITERSDPSRREALRDLAAAVASEDAEAQELLAGLIENPARMAWADLASHRKYRSAGVARRLLRAANEACAREPLDALTLADTAIEIAECLLNYAQPAMHELRGMAWKERANALRLLGRYSGAFEALEHADREFRHVPCAPVGPAIIQFIRGTLHYEQGDLVKANEYARASADAFRILGETDRFLSARHLQANILFAMNNIHAAKAIYAEILAWGEAESDLMWIARENNTLGRCAYELRDLSSAVQHFHLSAQAFRELGMSAEAARPEWGFALVVLASGKPAEALERFRVVREQFHARKMLTDEALVALDMMDALYGVGKVGQIIRLATEITQTFTNAGMLTSALTAFAYLKDAARRGTMSRDSVDHVRRFLGRLDHEPALLFLPPDEDSR